MSTIGTLNALALVGLLVAVLVAVYLTDRYLTRRKR